MRTAAGGLTEGVRADIGREGSLESLPLPCEAACRLDAEGVEVLRQRARQAGGRASCWWAACTR
ncbi:hypothetical protein ACFSKM_08745 [Ancylobacter dichloromethanicus]